MAQFPFGTRKTPAMHLTRRAASINASVDIKMCDPPKVFMKLLWKVGALSQIYRVKGAEKSNSNQGGKVDFRHFLSRFSVRFAKAVSVLCPRSAAYPNH